MNKIIFTCVSLVIWGASIEATIITPIDSTQVKKVELSSFFQNRVAVKEGRVSQLIHPGCDLDINLNDEIGQVFIYPLTHTPRPTSLTVVTDRGSVQDFELVFVDKPAEIVILEEPHSLSTEIEFEDLFCTKDCSDYRVNLVKKILKGEIPDGLAACDVVSESIFLNKGIKAVLVAKFVSINETIYLWGLENVSNKKQTISEMEVNFHHGGWVYLDSRCLNKKEETVAIVGVNHER